MKTPRSRLRRTAYHMVEASPGPLDRVPRQLGLLVVVGQARLRELLRVATRPS